MKPMSVVVKIRPLIHDDIVVGRTDRLKPNVCVFCALDGKSLTVEKYMSTTREFKFDRVHDPTSTVQDIFDNGPKDMVGKVICGGHNVSFIVYGQPMSGKSTLLFGDSTTEGLVHLSMATLFEGLLTQQSTSSVTLSFFQIVSKSSNRGPHNHHHALLSTYNDQIFDLLASESKALRQPLNIRDHPEHGVWVENVTCHRVHNVVDVDLLINAGSRNRITAPFKHEHCHNTYTHRTHRSHAVLRVVLHDTQHDSGSDKLGATESSDGNKSL